MFVMSMENGSVDSRGRGASGIGSKDVSSRGVIARKCIGGDECFVLVCKSIFILFLFRLFLGYPSNRI